MFKKSKKPENPHLTTIVEELKDGFCTIDLEGFFLYRNQAALDIFEMNNNNDELNFFNNIVRDNIQIKKIHDYLSINDFIKDFELDLYTIANKKLPVLLSINLTTNKINRSDLSLEMCCSQS